MVVVLPEPVGPTSAYTPPDSNQFSRALLRPVASIFNDFFQPSSSRPLRCCRDSDVASSAPRPNSCKRSANLCCTALLALLAGAAAAALAVRSEEHTSELQ